MYLFQLLRQLSSKVLQLLPVVDVLLQFIRDQFAVFLSDLLFLQQFAFKLPEVVQLHLLHLMSLAFLVVSHLGRNELLLQFIL